MAQTTLRGAALADVAHCGHGPHTGARAEALGAALANAGFDVAAQGLPAPRLDLLPGDLCAAVVALYRELGGEKEEPVLRPARGT